MKPLLHGSTRYIEGMTKVVCTARSHNVGRYVLKTARLLLREIEEGDFLPIKEMLQDIDVMYAWEHAFSDSEVFHWIHENKIRYARDGYGYWAVIETASTRFVGVCGLLAEQADGEICIGLGYIFNKNYWGKGYAAESAAACTEYAFRVLNLKEITAQIRPENAPSRKVAERLGMAVKKKFIKKYKGEDMIHLLYHRTA